MDEGKIHKMPVAKHIVGNKRVSNHKVNKGIVAVHPPLKSTFAFDPTKFPKMAAKVAMWKRSACSHAHDDSNAMMGIPGSSAQSSSFLGR